jgi:hypothetical protein
MNKPLLAILTATILMASIISQNSFAENSNCSVDCVAPTLGELDDGKKLVDKGFTINGQSFDVTGFSQTIPTQTFFVGQPITVKMLVYENNGVKSLRHVSLSINDYMGERSQNEKASIAFMQKFDGTQKVDVLDFDKMFENVTVTATPIDSVTTSVVFTFNFQKTLDTSEIIVNTWDDALSARKHIFFDAIKVEAKSMEKVKEEKTMEKKMADKKEEKGDEKMKKKSSDKKDDKSTKKLMPAKGKKKAKMPKYQ